LYSWLDLVLLALTSLFTSSMTAVVAVGGGAVMIATLLMFMPPAIAIPVQGMIQLVGAFGRVILMRKHISWPIVWRVAFLMPPGAALGLWLFQGLSQHVIELMIGSFVLLTLFSRQIKLFGGRELPLWGFLPLGFMIGALSVTVAVVAMFSGPFMIRKDLNKHAINVTMATIAVLGHIVKIAAFGFIGFRPLDHWAPVAAMIPTVILGTYLGERVLNRMSEEFFLWLFRISLGGLAAKLVLWDGILVPYVLS
jgi:uncharacterized membrane protein YfcA